MNKVINIVSITTLICILVFAKNTKAQPSRKMKKADSLYFAQDWAGAKKIYAKFLTDTSKNSIAWNQLGFSEYNTSNYADALKHYEKALANKPIPPVKASVYSRMARINALKNNPAVAIGNIDSALTYGYASFGELDSLKDFATIQGNADFRRVRDRVYVAAYPCMSNPKARAFDFWAGEWNVYVTGTQTLVGHSLVQIVSGGCAILENWDAKGGVSTGKSLNFIDGTTNMWRQCWIGSYPNGQQDFINGEYKDDAMRFTFTTTDAKGNKLIGHFIFYNISADKVRQFNETSADDGKTWTTSYDFTYIRVKNNK